MATINPTLRKLLNKIAEENGFENYDIDIKEILSGGANYSSTLYTAVVRETKNLRDDLPLFFKVCIIGEKIRQELSNSFFETEEYSYTTLWNIYKSLQEENGVPEDHRLMFPKFYGCDPTVYQEAIVLEDLAAQGYGSFDRFKSVDWEYASSAVSELAKMHALSFALRHKYPQKFEEVLDHLKKDWKEGAMGPVELNAQNNALREVKPEYREPLKKLLDKSMKDLLVKCYETVRHPVLVHADFRGSNLMHRVRADGTVEIKIVDLQTLQGGSPVTDLLYFIFTGSDEQFRAQYFDQLIDHYYNELAAALKRLHLNPDKVYSRENFDLELKEKLPFGLLLAVFTLPIITVDTDKAPEVNESLDIAAFSVANTSELYKERLNGVVDDYVKWGILK